MPEHDVMYFFSPGARLGICGLPVAMATEVLLINNAARHAKHKSETFKSYINSYQTLKAALPLKVSLVDLYIFQPSEDKYLDIYAFAVNCLQKGDSNIK